jgi:hypothetical protein
MTARFDTVTVPKSQVTDLQFCDIRDAWSKVQRTGQTFTWDTVPMMSRANRALSETNTIPQGNHTILQGTLTMSERGFSVPYTEALESLAMVSVRAPIMKVLKYDAMVDLDCVAHAEFNKTPLRAASTGTAVNVTVTTNSSATLTVTDNIGQVQWRSIVDEMKGRNIPLYDNKSYWAIARPLGLRLMKNQLEAVHQYTETGLQMIMNGEIGRYEDTRVVEQTVIPRGGATDSTTFNAFTDTADNWDTGGDWVFFFGADTVCEAVHTEEEIRAKNPDDFGRSKGIAWYALLGYGITHTNVTQARIIKFDSAA